ncbi:hypothetical protein L3X38_035401 [Prunus dulcis]|uniref:HAT C-terminal dimerisation domain-containing protein n=1 Tax=Prunus dulcis TaxID=3755 RepID=A0AAD4VM53_PRUDU|nr:hypothetical protein L3X38_035401 [Prunus dulcis]
MKFVIRVISLTCSASGCERNWSTFEQIHTNKRNRLEHQKLNALTYVNKRKVKSKSIRAMLMDEDDEIDKDPSTFDSGKYPFHIDTVDQYDSDASLNDISVEEWDE